ncbi:hypothetical protein FRC07_004313 [Ceratobasidium sp. 392]|nr:hypothetical protein FRC07_004313 [Ceratobasidium sp. 392]
MVFASSNQALPPTDGSIPLNSVVDFHLQRNPKHTWAVLAGINGDPPISVTYEQFGFAVHRAAHILNPGALLPRGTQIGILVSADTVIYLALIFGAMRAGLVPFPLSPRTQVAGISHLLNSTQTDRALVGGGQAIEELWDKIQGLPENRDRSWEVTRVPSASELFPDLGKNGAKLRPISRFPALAPTTDDSLVVIMHSSGSTGLPRALKLDHKSAFTNLVHQPACWELGGPGDCIGLMVLPAFHMMGFTWHGVMPLYVGYSPVFFAFSPTPIVPTAESTMKVMVAAGCNALMSVPAFLEAWSKDKVAISHLRKLRGLYYGGGALAEWVGNSLVKNGVRLQSAYGATEIGCVNKLRPTHPQRSSEDWAYLEFSEQLCPRFVPQNDEDGTYELVAIAIEEHKPLILNREFDGQPAYATKDLMVPHPTKRGLWKTVGRLDDQIVLANGEKTNPGAMEDVITNCPYVELAAMFGREKNQTGVLLEFTASAQSNYQGKSQTEIMKDIWPHIENANRVGPSHARLIPESVIFTRPDLPLLRTPKGTLSRAASLKVYSKDIERMYADLESNERSHFESRDLPSWNKQSEVESWLRHCLERILGNEVEVAVDLFQQGLDSLTATMLIRTIINTVNSSPDHNARTIATRLGQDTVFKYPTVSQMSDFILQLSSGASHSPEGSNDNGIGSIERMIKKYNDMSFPQTSLKPHYVSSERIVLTGTTGGLGCHLLAQLLASDQVERIWALNRKSSGTGRTIRQRQFDAFEDKRLNVALLDSPKLVLLESDITAEKLGLPSEIYEEINSTSSLFIHNAWQVNFNLSLQSFEPSIRGTHNLVSLALGSKQRPRFLFTSSVSVAGFGTPGGSLRETSVDISSAGTSIGYGQSKFVAEKLLEVARGNGLESCIVRLGQLAGDSNVGAWSLNDWIPSIIASSVTIGCLPDAIGSVSWTPLDVVAKGIIEISLSRDAILPPFVHCSHPRPIEWSRVMTMFSQALQSQTVQALPTVPLREWNDRIKCHISASEENERVLLSRLPTAKIQSTVDAMVRADEHLRARIEKGPEDSTREMEAGGSARLDTTQGERLSRSLKVVGELGEEDVRRWVDYWKTRALFSA